MRRVLILCEFPTLLGGERSLLSSLPELPAAGYFPIVAAPPLGPLWDALGRAEIERIPLDLGTRGGRDSLAIRRETLADAIHHAGPALVHANSLAMGRLAGPVAARLRLPSVAHLRDIVRLSRAAVNDLNCHRRLLAVSKATRTFHVAQGVDPSRTVVVYNGVDLARFHPRPPTGYLHRELRLDPAVRLVGGIGQLILRKGWDVFLAAAREVAARREDVHFVVVGERHSTKSETVELERTLHGAASCGSLLGRLHLIGGRDDMPRLLNELTVLVHAARQEPLGRVLLEAAASGCAVVATDVGGTREIFPPGKNAAILVPQDDAGAVAQGVAKVLDEELLRDRLGDAARQRAQQTFDARLAAQNLVRQYEAMESGCDSDHT